jgi:hypothetical protein
MKLSRDFLKKIVSEEVKNVLKEAELGTTITSNPKVIAYARYLKDAFKEQDVANLKPEILSNILDNQSYQNLTSDEKLRALGLVFGKRSQWPESLRNITVQMDSNADDMEVKIDAVPPTEKDKRIVAYAKMVRNVLGKASETMQSAQISNVLDDEGFKDLTYQEKMEALSMLYGNKISKWPENIRMVARGMDPNPSAGTAGPFGPAQQAISLTGAGGVKCAHAVAVQKQAIQIIGTLAKDFGLDDKQVQKLTSRLSGGVLGNTTLGVMKIFSSGQMTDKDYPLNNANSYKKACSLQKQVLDTILSNMNAKPREVVGTVMKATGVQGVAESKEDAFKKALKAAILKELEKNS